MTPDRKSAPSENKNISINGDVKDSAVIIGDNNTVNQTIIQKFFNIFKSDSETLEHRNRRILLGHVENAWIKGVLDASLHGAALLDLGIKQDLEAVTQYPWAIKKESTDEILPSGTSMLEIFDSIGMGRSLLILGVPGSGKTTMLLELARGLIARAREDITQPIPMVFNLASWTEKLTLADWLAQELNNLYSVPRKIAPDWVKGDKLLLLLDGLDEVRQESRAKCVEAINAFRKEHGFTSLAVCSRSQDYADLNAKLSFEGAIEVQPLTQKQITEFFNRFGKEMSGIKQALEKDTALREMAETPLFLSIMILAYRDKQDVDIWVSKEEKSQRKHLFDTYIERMFERPRSKVESFKKQDTHHWLSWLAQKMIEQNQGTYLFENMQGKWLAQKIQRSYNQILWRIILLGSGFRILGGGMLLFVILSMFFSMNSKYYNQNWWVLIIILLFTLPIILFVEFRRTLVDMFGEIGMVNKLTWDSIRTRTLLVGSKFRRKLVDTLGEIGMIDNLSLDWERIRILLILFLFAGLFSGFIAGLIDGLIIGLRMGLLVFISGLGLVLVRGLHRKSINQTTHPGQRISLSIRNSLSVTLLFTVIYGFIGALCGWISDSLVVGLISGVVLSLFSGLEYGGFAIIQHYTLRSILARNNLLPWRLVPFLDHCVDLIFLRRVGGGYIFVHRLLMEHFAEMYVETPTSKGN